MVDLTIESSSAFGTNKKIDSKDFHLTEDDDSFVASFAGQTRAPKLMAPQSNKVTEDDDSFAASFAGQTKAPTVAKQNKLSALNNLFKNKEEDNFEQFIAQLKDKTPKVNTHRPQITEAPKERIRQVEDDDESIGVARFKINLSPKKAKQMLAEQLKLVLPGNGKENE